MRREGEVRIPSGCAVSALLSRSGKRMSGDIVAKVNRGDARPFKRTWRRICGLWYLS